MLFFYLRFCKNYCPPPFFTLKLPEAIVCAVSRSWLLKFILFLELFSVEVLNGEEEGFIVNHSLQLYNLYLVEARI